MHDQKLFDLIETISPLLLTIITSQIECRTDFSNLCEVINTNNNGDESMNTTHKNRVFALPIFCDFKIDWL